jgi:hypothetical protein
MVEYQGYRSWNSWNVSLWINNTETLYFTAVELVNNHGRKEASAKLAEMYKGERTPDGGKYNRQCIYDAMEGMDD